jgi:hypothetical protein
MRCGVCHANLTIRGYRTVEVGNSNNGKRRVPLYNKCSRLNDPRAHPARFKGKPHPVGCLCDDCTVATGKTHAEADAACGREWTCQCGACKRARKINVDLPDDAAETLGDNRTGMELPI